MLNKENHRFKIGDYVKLIDGSGIFILEINKAYKVIDTNSNYKGEQRIALEGTDDEESYQYFNSRRFIKDVKILRKDKLKKIQRIYETNK